ncbi:hypothetical protein [Amycolatopsis sp. FDAARGOS 1241]|uniref:hypothetical protein n=1 Tax=Amycolatopsis sp. FDAARGOS 1241 TaxID=2778070 RepID=UPI001951724E|nr:hypothetical protein [Amycolatopsis sp. FDAARGOS 1241]QRP50151.1 hypothetical protein I6J71_22080 [Amycolatopsis sp. FDAARGOS 1241]
MNLEQIPFARWCLPLLGSACSVCGRPAETLWVLTDDRIVSHLGGAAPCRLPNPRPDADPAAAIGPGETSAA